MVCWGWRGWGVDRVLCEYERHATGAEARWRWTRVDLGVRNAIRCAVWRCGGSSAAPQNDTGFGLEERDPLRGGEMRGFFGCASE